MTETFSARVLRAALSIPRGRVTTYGRISKAAGGGSLGSRSVTAILTTASKQGVQDIPFHRIVYSDGRIWIDERSRKGRLKRYREEGIDIVDDRVRDFADLLFDY